MLCGPFAGTRAGRTRKTCTAGPSTLRGLLCFTCFRVGDQAKGLGEYSEAGLLVGAVLQELVPQTLIALAAEHLHACAKRNNEAIVGHVV